MANLRSQAEPRIQRGELIATVSRRGDRYQLLSPQLAETAPVLAGHYRITRLRPGFEIKCADVHDLHDLLIETEVGAGINLVFLIAGEAEARFGHQPLQLKADGARGDASMLSLAQREKFSRQSRRGRYERKVAISLAPQWLDARGFDAGRIADFRRDHLALLRWQPSLRAINLAEQMIAPPEQSEALLKLYLESRALELVTEAFARLEEQTPAPNEMSARAFKKLCELREWLDSGAAEGLSLQDIARHAGCNVHSLQEQFRTAFGSTVFDHLRSRRLQAARIALETQGVSVSQAAFLAGYSSAANFATAFKRSFGISPRQVRRS